MKTGTYLGGIRTVEDLRARCKIDCITGCWHWTMSTSGGVAKVHFVTPDTRKSITTRGRQAALWLLNGNDIPKGHRAFAIDTCEDFKTCVNPAHSTSGDAKAFGAFMARTGGSKTMRKAIACRALGRLRAKITMEDARVIRNSGETLEVLSARYGVAKSRIGYIKRNEAWTETVTGASIFNFSGTVEINPPIDPIPKDVGKARDQIGWKKSNARLSRIDLMALCERFDAIGPRHQVGDQLKWVAKAGREKMTELAKDYGLTCKHVWRIGTGRVWCDVTGRTPPKRSQA